MALSLVLYASGSISWGGRTSYLFVLSSGAEIPATAYIGTFVVSSWWLRLREWMGWRNM